MGSVVGVLQFPGSNCEMDCVLAIKRRFQIDAKLIWYKEEDLSEIRGLVVPGGFSFGDYLRGGAIAARLPVMESLHTFAKRGGAILGICNGFQILTEAGLLPGVLLRNIHDRFVCKVSSVRFTEGASMYQKTLAGLTLQLPIAHGEGRYFLPEDELKKLRDRDGVVCRYFEDNPNGSVDSIAGVVSENGKVFGLMPHPERASDPLAPGGLDGSAVLEAFMASFL